MTNHRNRKINSLATKATQLAVAVPQVVAHRMTRMALAGPSASARDRKEFQRMGSEKLAAFAASWNAMAVEVLRANQVLAFSFWRCFWLPSLWRRPSADALVAQMQSAALGVINKGMAPVHGKAVANARRLTRLH